MAQALDIDTLFTVLKASLPTHGPTLVKECASVYGFDLKTSSGKSIQYTLDLSQGSGSVEKGLRPGINTTMTMNEADALDFFLGKKSFRELYTSGKMKVVGSVGRIPRLKMSSMPQFTSENVRKYISPRL